MEKEYAEVQQEFMLIKQKNETKYIIWPKILKSDGSVFEKESIITFEYGDIIEVEDDGGDFYIWKDKEKVGPIDKKNVRPYSIISPIMVAFMKNEKET